MSDYIKLDKLDRSNLAIYCAIEHDFTTSNDKKLITHRLLIFNDGTFKVAKFRAPISRQYKSSYTLRNNEIAKIETTTSHSGRTTEITIKVTATNGRVDVFRPALSFNSDNLTVMAAQLPSLLSTMYGERYSKI